MKRKNPVLTILVFTFVYFVLLAGAFLDNSIIKIAGVAITLVFLIISSKQNSFRFLAALTPNLMIFSYKNDGMGLIALCYIVVCVKTFIELRTKPNWIDCILAFLLLVLTGIRIIDHNFLDVLSMASILVAVYVWRRYLKTSAFEMKKDMVLFFSIGITFLLFGMLFQYFFMENLSRLSGLLDDANYTAAAFAVILAVMLYFITNQIPFKGRFVFAAIGLLGGLLTGSRGFLLTIFLIFLFYCIDSIFNKESRKLLLIVLGCAVLMVILYFAKFPPIVSLYDKTIGRTLDLQNSYHEGAFMDITSGRIFLWGYYLNEMLNNLWIIFFGRGFDGYHLVENGGYGLVAHNSIVCGLMGFGFIGTIAIIVLYGRMFRDVKINPMGITILVSFVFPYMFIDGILDNRLVLYLAISCACFAIFEELEEKGLLPNKKKVVIDKFVIESGH